MTGAANPHNLTGLTLYIDTHIIDAADDASTTLKSLREAGWISLQQTDTMDTELADAPAEKWARLTEASAAYPEALGAAVVDHTRARTTRSWAVRRMQAASRTSTRSSSPTSTGLRPVTTTFATPCTSPPRSATEASPSSPVRDGS